MKYILKEPEGQFSGIRWDKNTKHIFQYDINLHLKIMANVINKLIRIFFQQKQENC